MVFYNYTKEKLEKKERGSMINDEICKLREVLNKSIVEGEDYSVVYQISIELDELIAKYYQEASRGEQKKKVRKTYSMLSMI